MNPSLLLVLLSCAAPAAAQADLADAFAQARRTVAASDVSAFKPSPAIIAGQRLADVRQRLLSRAGVGASLLKDLDDAGVAVTVAPGQTQPCALSSNGGRTAVSCSDSLASRDASEAALRLTERAAELRLAKMPDSPEKDYMIISLATRSWIEAGGQIMTEPAMRDRMRPWWSRSMSGQGSPADYAPVGAARKPSLDEMIAANGAAQVAAKAAISADERNLERADCESDGQGWLNARRDEETGLKRLQDEAAALQSWKKSLESFTREERAWLASWTPT